MKQFLIGTVALFLQHFCFSQNEAFLLATVTGQGTKTFFAENKDFFFAKDEDMQLEFTRDDQNKVEDFVLHQGGQLINCKKIK